MASPFRVHCRGSDFLHHTLNLTVQPKHLEEALTCLVESILYIRSRGKLVSSFPKGFREKTKCSNLKRCENFDFEYYAVKSKEIRQRIVEQICRFRWLAFVFTNDSSAEFYLNFYQCEAPPVSTADYVPFIGHVCEVWQINISTIQFDEEDASKQQIEQMITNLNGCMVYLHRHKFPRDYFGDATEYLELAKTFDMSCTDFSPCHFFIDRKFPEFAS